VVTTTISGEDVPIGVTACRAPSLTEMSNSKPLASNLPNCTQSAVSATIVATAGLTAA
jgi:hypothetical protein